MNRKLQKCDAQNFASPDLSKIAKNYHALYPYARKVIDGHIARGWPLPGFIQRPIDEILDTTPSSISNLMLCHTPAAREVTAAILRAMFNSLGPPRRCRVVKDLPRPTATPGPTLPVTIRTRPALARISELKPWDLTNLQWINPLLDNLGPGATLNDRVVFHAPNAFPPSHIRARPEMAMILLIISHKPADVPSRWLHPVIGLDWFIFQIHHTIGPRPSPQHGLARMNTHMPYAPGNIEWRTLADFGDGESLPKRRA